MVVGRGGLVWVLMPNVGESRTRERDGVAHGIGSSCRWWYWGIRSRERMVVLGTKKGFLSQDRLVESRVAHQKWMAGSGRRGGKELGVFFSLFIEFFFS